MKTLRIKDHATRILALTMSTIIALTLMVTSAFAIQPGPGIIMPEIDLPDPILVTGEAWGLVTDSLIYEFEIDEATVGEWKVYDYDFFKDSSKYDPNRADRLVDLSKETGWTGCSFYDDGTMIRWVGDDAMWDSWTKGYLVWQTVVPVYEIREISGKTYMFLEWKNGDYERTGVVPGLYVLEKVSSTPAEKPEPIVDDCAVSFIIRDGVLLKYFGRGVNLHVVIPEGVTKLADHCMSYHHGIIEVTLPSTLESVNMKAFEYSNNLKAIHMSKGK